MLRNFIKRLPIINLWHWCRRLSLDLSLTEQQLSLVVEQLAQAQNSLLAKRDLLTSEHGKLGVLHTRVKKIDQTNANVIDQNAINPNTINLNSKGLERSSPKVEGLIVSLTSYGHRTHLVHHTILSLLTQTVRAEKVILWLSEQDYSFDNLPDSLIALQKHGLEIGFCPDIRSYKKLIPTLKQYPDYDVITVDDDVIYPRDHIEKLYNTSKRYPDCVVCHLAHRISLKKASAHAHGDSDGVVLLPYKKWSNGIAQTEPAADVFPVGVGGVLYPKGSLDEEVLNEEKFNAICPYADDIWFKLMALKIGTMTKVVDNPIPYRQYLHIPDTQHISLWQINHFHNDRQIEAVLKAYPEINSRLANEATA